MRTADPIRIISRIKNNRLMETREGLGLSALEASAKIGMSYSTYLKLESLKGFPTEEVALKISIAFEVSIEELFPEYLKQISVTKTSRTISEPVMLQLSRSIERRLIEGPRQEVDIQKNEIAKLLNSALDTLDNRKKTVLKMAYGLEGQEYTSKEIGEILGVSDKRVRQIHNAALRDMSHPARLRELVSPNKWQSTKSQKSNSPKA